jgi:HEPN domain-containing protein
MSEKADLVDGWLAKADSDLAAGQRLLPDGPFDVVCFHAQQAIEKLLKALLAFYDQPPPRTHDLEELQRILLAIRANTDLAALDLFEASDYAVMARYDLQFWPDEETATDALTLAKTVKRIVVAALAAG